MTTDKAPEREPCPFCGSRGIDRDNYWHRNYCTNCGSKGPAAGNSVKANWNTRVALAPAAPSPDVLALVEAVQHLKETLSLNIVEKDGPNTVSLPDGTIQSGPVVDFLHDLVRVQIRYLDAALARITDTGGRKDG